MKYTFTLALILTCISLSSQRLFKVDTTSQPREYLEYILDSHNVKINNITYRGQKSAIGTFKFNNKSFEIKKGIVLSTGNVNTIKGGNKTPGTSGLAWDNDYRFKRDRDLGKLSKGKVCDQAFIEFDFIPLENEVSFNFIFASEEFKEYVGSRFNDVFGFIVTGDDNYYRNIALIPDRSIPVTINNVNHLRNSEFFVNNNCFENSNIKKIIDDSEPRTPFIKDIIVKLFGEKNKDFTINEEVKSSLDQELFNNFEFDGLTKKLKAVCHLIPYKVYHMKIAVGDVGDPMFDSGVFIEFNSFSSIKNIKAPFFKNYEDLRGKINYDSLFNLKVLEPIRIDSPPQIEEQFEITNVNFDYDKHMIPDSSQIAIRELALYLKKNPDYRVHLLGYTDNIGSMEYNQALSVKRAEEVRNLLVKNGIVNGRINFIGNNYADPLGDNYTEYGRSLNRRVEIVVLE